MLYSLAALVVLVIASLSSMFCAPDDVDYEIYVGQNERLLESLPPAGGMELVGKESLPYDGSLCDLCPRYVAGYRTQASYRTPAGLTQEHIIWHYATMLDGWDYSIGALPFEWLDEAAATSLFGDSSGFLLIASRRHAQIIIETGLPDGAGYDDGLLHIVVDFQYHKSGVPGGD